MNEAYQARPTEIMHGEIMRLFHRHRVKEVGKMKLYVMLCGSEIAAMIVKAKNLANEQSLQDEAAAPQWQDISSADEDEEIIVWVGYDAPSYYCTIRKVWVCRATGDRFDTTPTHFQPRLKGPKQ